MIVIADLWMYDKTHVPFNAAMIQIINNVFPDEMSFFAEKKHYENIQLLLEDGIIDHYYAIDQIEGGKLKHIIKELKAVYYLFKVVMFCRNNNVRQLVLLYTYPPSQYIFEAIRKLVLPNTKVLVVLHGEIGWMLEKDVLHRKLCGHLIERALLLNLSDKNRKYIVLGKTIKENLIKHIAKINDTTILNIDHPYLYTPVPYHKVNFNRITVGSIGTADRTRNVQHIFELGMMCKELVQKGNVNFKIIGAINPDILQYKNNYVKCGEGNQKISRALFEDEVKKIDYAIFFRDNSQYNMRASGALFDALQFEKPIIAIRNDFINHYFQRFGNIGYLCNDLKEVETVIGYISRTKPITEYKDQVRNLKHAKQELSIKNISNSLRDSLAKEV